MDNSGKEKIEVIFLDMPGIKEAQWNMKAFSKMSKLRLLKINNVQLSEGPEDLSNKLRFLEWHSYPSKSLPAGLQVDELVELHMANSSIEQLWYGCKRHSSSSNAAAADPSPPLPAAQAAAGMAPAEVAAAAAPVVDLAALPLDLGERALVSEQQWLEQLSEQ
ncbi:hypothetical protein NC653_034459 [Populus alba x Populus x berolinensis]|uniref:Uncharacterized protein n=1 Tax=Populus alba x Populus x berolinensis TaxID=444605 RepID=A0AAD6LMQ6_9ROSI|nr:hypothetical protein NC653_034459 [Populus alba x Populus x berolinensis]